MQIPRHLPAIAIGMIFGSATTIVILAFAGLIATSKPEVANPLSRPESEEAGTAIYGNRTEHYAELFGGLLSPDPDWRDVLDDRLAAAEPKWSQGFEELIIRDFFGERKGGFFLDVGCSFPRKNSTTYYLEENLQWSGIGIDVIPEYGEAWEESRPNSKFVCFAVADTDAEQVTLYVRGDTSHVGEVVSLNEQEATEWHGKKTREVKVTSITLNTLLEQEGIEKLDFLSMDIEGAEPAALRGFDIRRYKPDMCCVEAAILGSTELRIVAYFAANGYEVIEKYRKVDKQNLYFRPMMAE